MQQLLFTVVFSQMALIMVLLFKTTLRKLVIMWIDQAKRGHGPVVVKTVAATVFVLLMSSLFSKRRIDQLAFNPTEQVLMDNHLLEATLMGNHLLDATLMGASLFLTLIIGRLHHYIKELRIQRKSMKAMRKQNQSFENGKVAAEETKALEEEMITLKAKLKQLESELETKSEEVKAAEAIKVALGMLFEGFLLENDCLLEENQNLRSQLQSFDQKLSHPGASLFLALMIDRFHHCIGELQ